MRHKCVALAGKVQRWLRHGDAVMTRVFRLSHSLRSKEGRGRFLRRLYHRQTDSIAVRLMKDIR